MINSKDPSSYLKPFKGNFKNIYFLDNPEQKNYIKKEELQKVASKLNIRSEIADNFKEIKKKMNNKSNSLYLCTGSLYWIGYLLSRN
jgi:folylpolyglutamate synthase/dihydropteroate synthase